MTDPTPFKPETWPVDADGYTPDLCTECGTPVRYGSRHSVCGRKAMGLPTAAKARAAAQPAPAQPIPDHQPRIARVIAKGGKYTRGLYENPSDEHMLGWEFDGDTVQWLVPADTPQPAPAAVPADHFPDAGNMVPAGWQPIETAPKDGTTVLLASLGRVTAGEWHPEQYSTASEYHGTTGEYLGQYETGEFIPAAWYSWDGGFTDEHPPTHWMPLPAAPAPATGEPTDDMARAYLAAAPGPLTGKYGEVLAPFVALMEAELHANAGKGDRPGWLLMTPSTALLEIYWHTAKLSAAVKNNDAALIREHSADVANMAMMLLDVCVGITATPQPAPAAVPADPWQPIETAPENMPRLAVVFWWSDDGEDMYDFDYKEDGCWMKWHDHADHVKCIGGHGVSYTPPYTHWMPSPAAPAPATGGEHE